MSVLVIDKPSGPTSFEVVARVRKALVAVWGADARKLKVGHGGTLDPMATGVLPICIGEATKLAPFLLNADKAYEAEVCFGVQTDTLDAAGAVVARAPVDALSEQRLRDLLPRFTGDLEQLPPMYSALKRDGKPLYVYARAGIEVERAARKVRVYTLTLTAWLPPDRARFVIHCSKGTYIRSLAADLGTALETGAHLAALRRTLSGPFGLDAAITLDELAAAVVRREFPPLVSLVAALGHLGSVTAPLEVALRLEQGKRVPWPDLGILGSAGDHMVAVLRPGGSLLAVVRPGPDGNVKSLRVFREQTMRDAHHP